MAPGDLIGTGLAELGIGARYLRVHYEADPTKGAEYAAGLKSLLGGREFASQMDMSPIDPSGIPVYETYVHDRHCPVDYRAKPFPMMADHSVLIGGWDAGQSLMPAFVLWELRPPQWQALVHFEVCADRPMPMSEFAPIVADRLLTYCPARRHMVQHWGDPTITTRSGSTGESAQEICKTKTGIWISASTNVWNVRYSAVQSVMNRSIEGGEAYLVNGLLCPILVLGFQGAYKFGVDKSGGLVQRLEPVKNQYSHPHDANQAAAIYAESIIAGKRNTSSKRLRRVT